MFKSLNVMKTKFLLLGIFMLMGISMTIYAQPSEHLKKSRVNNLHIGATYGYYDISLKKSEGGKQLGYDLKFKSSYGLDLAFEKESLEYAFGVSNTMVEMYLNVSQLDKCEPAKDMRADYPYPAIKDLYEGGLICYLGWTLFKHKQLKLNLFLGAGADYINGKQMSKISVDAAAKLRFKAYLSHKVGFFAGVGGRLARLPYNQHVTLDGKASTIEYPYSRTTVNAEAGFVIDLK